MKRLRSRRRGFTLVEVMVSLGIMTIGAMAVIALQTQTLRSNAYARQVTTATQVAQIWIERLKQDGCMWSQPADPTGASPDPATVLARTRYLQSIVTNNGRWVSPPDQDTRDPAATPPRISRGFDVQGNDTAAGADVTPFYCSAYRLQWVLFGSAIRSDVRVWWPRAGSGAMPSDFPGCGSGADLSILDPGKGAYPNYHVVYLSTVIKVTKVER